MHRGYQILLSLYFFTLYGNINACDFNFAPNSCFQLPDTITKGSAYWKEIKQNPNATLRNHLFKMTDSSFSRQAVELAVKFGADVNSPPANSKGVIIKNSSLLAQAIDFDRLDTVTWLLEHGASLQPHPGKIIHPFLMACGGGKSKIVDLLLQHDPQLIHITSQYSDKWTPLHCACLSGEQETVELLLDKNPSLIDKEDATGEGPLYTACRRGHVHLVRLFLHRNPRLVCKKNGLGNTLLYSAVCENQLEVVTTLLELDSRVPVWTKEMEASLQVARSHNDTKLYEFLSHVKTSRTPKKQTKFEIAEGMLANGATIQLVAQWLIGIVPDGPPYTFSLFTESNADFRKVARLAQMFSRKT